MTARSAVQPGDSVTCKPPLAGSHLFSRFGRYGSKGRGEGLYRGGGGECKESEQGEVEGRDSVPVPLRSAIPRVCEFDWPVIPTSCFYGLVFMLSVWQCC